MQVKVKEGTIHIPSDLWEKANLPKDGNYEVEADCGQIIIKIKHKEHERLITSIKKHGFVGMWANREDMTDSQEWVRKQRTSWRNKN